MDNETVKHPEKKRRDLLKVCRENPWIVSTVALAIVVILLLIPFSSLTGKVVSGDAAAQKLLALYTSNGVTGLTVKSVEEVSGVYEVTFNYNSNEVPIFVTKDAKYVGSLSAVPDSTKSSGSSSSSSSTSAEIPKSDKPKVELFVWGYCPYGVAAQGPLAQVAKLLSSYATFEIVPYYDGHGAFETQQNKIQLCIQKLYSEKYWDYASLFVEKVYPKCASARTEECDKTESTTIMKSLGIDSTKVFECVSSQGDSLFEAAAKKAQENGVSGSPTVLINGVKANVARNAEAYKSAVCNAFNDVPSACGSELSSDTTQASGNC